MKIASFRSKMSRKKKENYSHSASIFMLLSSRKMKIKENSFNENEQLTKRFGNMSPPNIRKNILQLSWYWRLKSIVFSEDKTPKFSITKLKKRSIMQGVYRWAIRNTHLQMRFRITLCLVVCIVVFKVSFSFSVKAVVG